MTIPLSPIVEDWSFAQVKRSAKLWGPHGYHRYPAKFIPQLVHSIIASYSSPDDLVGDPFLGSATTGVEALRMRRRFWGADINDVALLISRAKCLPLHPSALKSAWQQLDHRLDALPCVGNRQLTSVEKDTIHAIDIAHASSAEERLAYWFPAAYRASLEQIFQAILMCSDEAIRTFFLCSFSHILKRCSIWLSGSTKVQKDVNKVLADPVEEFLRHSLAMIKGNALYWHDLIAQGLQPEELSHRYKVDWNDARHVMLPDATFDLLVTSPPYATCYEYKEIHQLTQLWLEYYGLLAVSETQKAWIGSKTITHRALPESSFSLYTASTTAEAVLAELSLLAIGSLTASVKREVCALHYYFQDMSIVIRELARMTIPGKYLVLVIGDSYRRGITIPTSQVFCEMAHGVGLELERRIVRKIPSRILVSTRNKTTGRFSSVAHSDIQVYPEEYILVFRRPS